MDILGVLGDCKGHFGGEIGLFCEKIVLFCEEMGLFWCLPWSCAAIVNRCASCEAFVTGGEEGRTQILMVDVHICIYIYIYTHIFIFYTPVDEYIYIYVCMYICAKFMLSHLSNSDVYGRYKR